MTTLNDLNYVDDSDDVMAVHVNNLLGAALRSEYKNVESLSATRTLLDVDTPLQRFDCNGANRIVKMPTADAVENHPYLIVNSTASGTYTLTVQNNGATITHAALNPSEFILMMPDGNGTYLPFGKPFNGILTPAQITSNQDNYNPTGAGAADVLRISSDAARSITGLGFPAQNKTIVVTNVGSYTITLKNDATSTAANRFLLGADFDLETNKSVILIYDVTSSRWRMVGGGSSANLALYLLASGLSEWDEQGSDPSTPGTNKWKLYFKENGLHHKDDAGAVVGPVGYHDVAAHARQTADQTGIVTSTNTVIVFPQEDKDTDSFFNGATGKFQPTSKGGTYKISTHVAITSLGDGKTLWVGIRKNGTTYRWLGLVAAGAATTVGIGGGIDVYLNGSTDYVEIILWHNHGSNRDSYSGSNDDVCWFDAVRVSALDLCGW